MVIGFTSYALFLSQSDVSNIVSSKNFGTISTSLGSPFLGSLEASLTIIEFGNYQCNECQKWFQETMPVIMTDYVDTGEINLIFIDTQLTQKVPLASFASYCANDQKKYWDYHNMLFQNSIENKIDSNLLKRFATELELNMNSFEECLNTEKYEKKVKYSTYEAKKNGINKIPTFVIIDSAGNYEKILGYQSFSIFEEKIMSLQNKFQK